MNTGRLYIDLNALTDFKFTVKGVYSTTTGTDHGYITLRLIDIWGNVALPSYGFTINGTPSDYSIVYSDHVRPIARADLMCSDNSVGTTVFYVTGGTNIINYGKLYWLGWVKPDNMTRPFITKSYLLRLTAGDGLADLKDVDFPLTAATGNYDIYINHIKNALYQNGISLPIVSQVNIIENALMTTGQTLFNVVQANAVRFTDDNDGRLKSISAYDALDYLLKPFNCRISQVNGNWFIGAQNEVLSRATTFDYTTSSNYFKTLDRTCDISNYKIQVGSDELSKVQPLAEAESTYRNFQTSLTNALTNGTFDTTISGWTNGSYPYTWSTFERATDFGGALHTAAQDEDSNENHYFESTNFSLTKTSDNDYITFRTDLFFDNDPFGTPPPDVIYPTKNNPTLQFVLKNPTGGTVEDIPQRLKNGWGTYANSNTRKFPITSTGNYKLGIFIYPDGTSTYTGYDLYFDNIKVFANVENTSYDHYYQGTIQNSTSTSVGQYELFFGDGIQNNEVGNLKIGSTLTQLWATNSTVSENLSLQQLFNKLKLICSGRFKDYLRLTVKDSSTINFNSAVKINSTTYSIANYEYDLKNGNLDLELVEVLTTIPTILYTDSALSTVNGQ